MPRITINEIDRSITTRAINDNVVRVLIPGIATFGPVYNPEEESANTMTFNNAQSFLKVYGSNDVENSPLLNDVSRLYALQLIKKGAEVTFVRLNDGRFSTLDIGKISEETGEHLIPECIYRVSDEWYKDVEDSLETDEKVLEVTLTYKKNTASGSDTEEVTETVYFSLSPTYSTKINDIDENETTIWKWGGKDTLSDQQNPCVTATAIKYNNVTENSEKTINIDYSWFTRNNFECTYFEKSYDADKYKFCRQVESIEAKYTGSFGNRLLIAITPVKSAKISYNYQYANITVYNAKVKTSINSAGKAVKTITEVSKLENRMVTTNPNDPYYFEDVEFDYIKINATATARQELTIAWSNRIQATTDDGNFYSGFPTIPLKYTDTNGIVKYNSYALMTGGSDFNFSDKMIDIFNMGYTGLKYASTGGSNNLKISSNYINRFIMECYTDYIVNNDSEDALNKFNDDLKNKAQIYGTGGIMASIYNRLHSCYTQFTDPYIYDFDYITSAGLLDEEVVIYKNNDGVGYVTSNIDTLDHHESTLIPTHVYMKELVETRKDCVALCDVYSTYSKTLIPDYVRMIDSSYCTVHNPWCYVTNPYTGALVLMPPSFVFLDTFLNYMASGGAFKWYPPAGVTRATTSCVVKPMYEIGSVILDAWTNDTTSRVNPIMKLKNYGYVIYGQYTALEAIDEYTHSALESLNVRLISNAIKKRVFEVCLQLTFEPNNTLLYDKFKLMMSEYLNIMKTNSGLYDYKIVMDSTTVTTDDINELKVPGKIYIAPTRTAEYFDVDFIITDAGANFDE